MLGIRELVFYFLQMLSDVHSIEMKHLEKPKQYIYVSGDYAGPHVRDAKAKCLRDVISVS